jgi:stage II sporulation protein AA (anti-sigma F factor antagonist)
MAGQVFDDEPVVVGLPAEIDVANADEVLDLLCSAAGAGVRVVVGDLSSTRFCDCYGFRALVAARKQLAAAGVDLWLAVPPGNVRRVMRLLGVDHGLDAYPPVAAVKGDDGRG